MGRVADVRVDHLRVKRRLLIRQVGIEEIETAQLAVNTHG